MRDKKRVYNFKKKDFFKIYLLLHIFIINN